MNVPIEPIRPRPSTRVARCTPSRITEIADGARERVSVIKLWVGESDLRTPDFVCRAATDAIAAGHTGYTYALGLPSLRASLADYHLRHWGVEIATDRFSATVGGMNAIMQALQALLEPGDEVLHPSPIWPNLVEATRIAGGRAVPVEMKKLPEDGFTLDLDQFFAMVGPRTRVVAINSPSNPTGWSMPLDQMIALRDFARQRGLWILSDEVYNQLRYDGTIAPSFLQITEPDDRLIVTNTFSKNWAMTGWRIGWVVFPAGFAPHFDNLSQFNTTGVATFLQHAAREALDRGDGFIDTLREYARKSGRIFCDTLSAALGQHVVMPEGTFYLMLDTARFGDSMGVARKLLHEADVGVAPGLAFGPGGENHIRICFAVAPERAEQAATRIAGCLAMPPRRKGAMT